ncbi:hypothetical protein [Methylophaga sp.]|uniref:hypothetical protein n=1 Tax=Methylophaga sp. TaxID=2024840 RepID=UPI0025EC2BB9|nr:hypothetical protein [Methylophaga sp.]
MIYESTILTEFSFKLLFVLQKSIELDYGDGHITVEMEDGDSNADGYKLMLRDEV